MRLFLLLSVFFLALQDAAKADLASGCLKTTNQENQQALADSVTCSRSVPEPILVKDSVTDWHFKYDSAQRIGYEKARFGSKKIAIENKGCTYFVLTVHLSYPASGQLPRKKAFRNLIKTVQKVLKWQPVDFEKAVESVKKDSKSINEGTREYFSREGAAEFFIFEAFTPGREKAKTEIRVSFYKGVL